MFDKQQLWKKHLMVYQKNLKLMLEAPKHSLTLTYELSIPQDVPCF